MVLPGLIDRCALLIGSPGMLNSYLRRFQGSEEILDQILCILDSDGYAHRVFIDTGILLLPICVFRKNRCRGEKYKSAHVSYVGSNAGIAQAVDHLPCGLR